MTDSDDKLARRYRSIAREEPGAALDAAILAASRRAVAAKPALSRRWAAPVSIAAVLVLALGVTLRMQLEEPGIESSAPAATAPPALPAFEPPRSAAAPTQDAKPGLAATARDRNDAAVPVQAVPAPRPKAAAPQERAPAALQKAESANRPTVPEGKEERMSVAPQSVAEPAARTMNAAPPPPASPAAGAAAPQRMKREAASDTAQSLARPLAAPAQAQAERELERIAKLREEGRHAEADKALEQFRRDHPAYRIPEAVWDRVRPR